MDDPQRAKRPKRFDAALEDADWTVRSVEKRERRRNPAAPFTTSKFQQDASRKLGISVKRAMMIAQRLYEGVELGDEARSASSPTCVPIRPRVSNDALAEVREVIGKDYGKQFLPESAERLQDEARMRRKRTKRSVRPRSRGIRTR